jgi:hypothetical protein
MAPSTPPRCATCRKTPAECYDERTGRPLCAKCWLKKERTTRT